MSDLATFMQLGFLHITDLGGMDHILFLVALAAIYRFTDWRRVVGVITAFTIGHSITLVLAVTGLMAVPSAIIEFLIPLTIVATGIENILVRDRTISVWGHRYRPVFAGVFGLVHGAGFANYLNSMFVDPITVPLLGFNIGIELGQLTVLVAIALVLALVDRVIAMSPRLPAGGDPLRVRVVAVSVVVVGVASLWAIERSPW